MRKVTQFSVLNGYHITITLSCGHILRQRAQWRWINGWWLKEPVRRRCPVCEPAAAPVTHMSIPAPEDLSRGLNPS